MTVRSRDTGTSAATGPAGVAGDADAHAPDDGGYVQSLARGLAVIAAFDAEHPSMTLSEVARRTELSRAAARRFLLTLEHLGYVRSDGRDFALTPVYKFVYQFIRLIAIFTQKQ